MKRFGLLLLCLIASATALAQTTVTINSLPAANTPLAGTEAVPVFQTGQCSAQSGTCQATATNVGNASVLTGDAAKSAGSTATVVSKTGGVAFATSATTDTTNATNIVSGTLAASRLNAPATLILINGVASAFTATITNVATLSGSPTMDGISVPVGQVVFLAGQTTTSQNGPWTVNSGAWTRPVWFASGFILSANCDIQILIQRGTVYQGLSFWLNTTSAITIDTTAQSWSRSAINPTTLGAASGAGSVTTADCASWGSTGTTYSLQDSGDLNSNKGACLTQSQTTGHSQFTNGGAPPTASAGTINTNSTDEFGVVTGLSTATTLTITFGAGFPNSFASCVANSSPAVAIAPAYTVVSGNVTAVVFTFPSLTGSLSYHCRGTG